MIRLYERLVRCCKTINQINRIHIALENWMTPQQWSSLRAALLQSPGYEFLHHPADGKPVSAYDISHAQRKWVEVLQGMYSKAPAATPQKFMRYRLRRHICWYRPADSLTHSKTLVVCFTGAAQRMMTPLPVFLQHLDAARVDVVLIRYPLAKGYRNGLEGVADSFEGTVTAFENILPASQYARQVAIGVSGGGIPALLTSLRLGFDAALSFSGGHPNDRRWNEALGYNGEHLIRKFRQQAGKLLSLFLVYGSGAHADEVAAQALARLLPATLVKIGDENKTVGHVSLHPLLMSGKLSHFLAETVLKPGQFAQ